MKEAPMRTSKEQSLKLKNKLYEMQPEFGQRELRVAELFAGVGGFRIGFETSKRFRVVLSNQWEPPGREERQFAHRCYVERFGANGHYNEDISSLIASFEKKERPLPKIDVLCGGFPCQDYSVAKPVNASKGLEGTKGVLWWEIYRLLRLYKKRKSQPKYVVLENVDRLLKSPSQQKGRDFAIVLLCLNKLGYQVEWRVINAADYGSAQRRRRVFLVAYRGYTRPQDAPQLLLRHGIMARAFPCKADAKHKHVVQFELSQDEVTLSRSFGKAALTSQFKNAGVAVDGVVYTQSVLPKFRGKKRVLKDVISNSPSVPAEYYLSRDGLDAWHYAKNAKRIDRVHKASGAAYQYVEGSVSFPDAMNRPARTILTSEGGRSASRTKHVIRDSRGLRRLIPEELERLNEFPRGWTNTGMSPAERAFCMGNALVVGMVRRIAKQIEIHNQERP